MLEKCQKRKNPDPTSGPNILHADILRRLVPVQMQFWRKTGLEEQQTVMKIRTRLPRLDQKRTIWHFEDERCDVIGSSEKLTAGPYASMQKVPMDRRREGIWCPEPIFVCIRGLLFRKQNGRGFSPHGRFPAQLGCHSREMCLNYNTS